MSRKHLIDFINLFVLCLLTIIIRLIPLSKYLYDSEHHFLGTNIIYLFDADSYVYASSYHNLDLIVMFSLILYGILFFYLILRYLSISKLYSFLGTLLLSVFPSYYNQTLLNNIDTPIFIISVLILVTLLMVFSIDNNIIIKLYLGISTLFTLWVLYLCWGRGVFIIINILVFALFLTYFPKSKYILVFCLIGIGFLFWRFSQGFLGLLYQKGMGVSEYMMPSFPLYYFLFVLMVFFAIKYHDYVFKNKVIKFILSCGLMFFLLSIFIGRFQVFALIYIIIIITLFMDKIGGKHKLLVVIMFAFIFISLNTTYFEYKDYEVPMFRAYESELRNLDADKSILNIWDKGNLINYFTEYDIRFKAYPEIVTKDFVSGVLSKDGTDILDRLNHTPCYYLIIHYSDFPALAMYRYKFNISISADSILSKIVRNESLIKFRLHKHLIDEVDRIWIYERKCNM